MKPFAPVAGVLLALTSSSIAAAQTPIPSPERRNLSGVVLDQTGLPLAGVRLQLLDGSSVVTTQMTADDGSFSIDPRLPGDAILATLEGFEPTRVARSEATRIVLKLAHAAEETTVVAIPASPISPATTLLDSRLTTTTIARLPSSHMKPRESLPLLPSVIRGPDGLMHIAGSRAYDTPLSLDGFNLTDPATGLSSVNLPYEAVASIDVLHDPMAVTYGGLIGGLVKIDSKPGNDRFEKAFQGFVPRPRFASPGFGRIDGVFPRAYTGGSTAIGRVRYMAAAEYDYEHVAVPDVTNGLGPDILEESAIAFTRIDARSGQRHQLTLEALISPTATKSSGLSPRREVSATADITGRDLFAGITERISVGRSTFFNLQLGALGHDAKVTPNGTGPSYLGPKGWRGNWFSTIDRSAQRYTAAATWEQIITTRTASRATHDVTVGAEFTPRALKAHVAEGSVIVSNAAGRKVRSIDSSAAATVVARDRPAGLVARDVWHVNEQLEIDVGSRLDHTQYAGSAPSARLAFRYAIDPAGVTVVKAGYGSFIGTLPLNVLAFKDYPARVDRAFDAATGKLVRETIMRPAVGDLRLPRAVAGTVSLERQLAPGLDTLVAYTNRRTSDTAILRVPSVSGKLMVDSTGVGRYWDAQVAVRRVWADDQQLFVSYTRSALQGDLNEFAAVFQSEDAPLLQPGGMSHLATDAPNRLLAWGSFNLPRRTVVSPMAEWRSGFRFSALDARYEYDGLANALTFPTFFTLDMLVYKTFTVQKRSADLGFQVFNATNHRNPRDVNPVVDGALPTEFDNNVGTTLRGYMRLRW